jgi:hypothetical protein
VTADSGRSRAVARRTLSAAVLVTAFSCGSFVLASAPTAEAAMRPHLRVQPHTTASPTATKGHGHGTQGGATKPGHHGSKTPTSTTTISPRVATSATAAPAVSHATSASSGTSWTGTGVASHPPAATTKPSPSDAAAPTAADSTWRRDDPDHADRGVVRAFASGLKSAGQSAGFPALLLAVMAAFLLVQHRLDRRDEKLSRADWATDQGLEFSAPATIQPRATVPQ